ncbi:MAG: LamG domain-containing protein [Sandaracinaceae bacterium]|nr:LamG domain-containing protein [Sandaracinaceae bacterium]
MRSWVGSWAVLCAVALTGCTGTDAGLAVDLRTNYVSQIDFDEVEVRFDDGVVLTQPASVSREWFTGVRVGTREPLDSPTPLTARLLRGGVEVAARALVAGGDGARALTVLVSRECGGLSCPSGDDPPQATSCLAGRCVEPTCARGDEASCPPARCRADVECRTPLACAASICFGGACGARAGSGCLPEQYCDLDTGECTARPGIDAGAELSDAGLGDAGADDDAGADGDAGADDDAGAGDAATGARDAGAEPLTELGVLARYFLDEGSVGVYQNAFGPEALLLENRGSVRFEATPGRAGLIFTRVGADARACVAIDGTRLARLDGAREATIEAVVRLEAGSPNGSRIAHFGPADTTWSFSIGYDDVTRVRFGMDPARDTAGRWTADLAAARAVVTLVYDGGAPEAERARLYVDGVRAPEAAPTTRPHALVDLSRATHFCVGNRLIGQRTPSGTIHYVALYERALGAAEIDAHVARLLANDDP